MKKKLLKNIIVSFCIFATTLCVAQPANDACSGATNLNLGGPCVNGTTAGAADNIIGAVGCQSGGGVNGVNEDVWYQFTSTGTQFNATITSSAPFAGNIEAVLWSGNCITGTIIGTNCGTSPLAVNITGLTPGTTYFFVVSNQGGNAGTPGPISICNYSTSTSACTANDDCFSAQPITLNAVGAASVCITGCNVGANPGLDFVGNGCEDMLNPTVWYTFTTGATAASINVNLTSATMTNPEFTIYSNTSSCLGPYTIVQCLEGAAGSATLSQMPVAINTTYYIAVSDASADVGTFNLCIAQNPDNSACNTNDALVVSATSLGSPLAGPYKPGEVVSFCYTLTNWQMINCNYLGAVVPSFGSCWDPASFNAQGMPVTITTPLNVNGIIQTSPGGPQNACAGTPAGSWNWFPAGAATYNVANGSLPVGSPMGAGWYFLSSYNPATGGCTGDPTDPDNTFGDGNYPNCGTNTFDYTLCFRLTAGPGANCGTGATNCGVSIKTYADGEFGAWTSIGCTVDAPAVLSATLVCCAQPTITSVNTFTVCSGSAVSIPFTSSIASTFSWLATPNASVTGESTTAQTTATLNNILTNTTSSVKVVVYTVTPTSTAGCLGIPQTITVTVNPLPTLVVSGTNSVCSGSSTTLSVTGASTYTWSPAISLSTVSGSVVVATPTANTTYTVIGTSASGCTNTTVYSVTVAPKPVIVLNSNAPLCAGLTLSLTASGASTYTWSGSGLTTTTGSAVTTANPATGTYSVTGTSTLGCQSSNTISVVINPKPAATLSFTNPTCGLNNGIITIIPTNTVSISTITSTSGTVTGQTITGLGAGSPIITLTSNLGCTFTVSATLTMTPGPSSIAITPTNATCGNNNGSFTFSGSGGTPSYSYAINNSGVFSAISPTTGLAPGTYSVTVKDANGCLLTQTTSIVAISTPTAITGSSSPASCAGATGSYTVAGVSGGVATYSYSIDGGAFTTPTVITNLSSGTHSIAVKDANGCTFQTTFSVGVVAGITSATVNASTASCGTANATATVTTISGGVPSYSFSFDGGAFTASSSTVGLAAGNHNVLIRDVNTCTLTVPFTVISLGSPTTSITSFSNVTCFGLSNGSCTVAIPTGGAGAPFTYTLTSPFQSNGIGVFTGLPAGTYNISVEDAAGCIATTSVIIGQPAALTVSATAAPVLCNGGSTGSINLTGLGGTTTYSYNLNGGAYQTSSTFSNQLAGIYTMGITDANGCIATQTVQITQPTALSIAVSSQSANCTAANGIASATVSGGAGSFTYNWTPTGGTAATSIPMIGGTYTITATDANTCSISSPVVIGVATGGTAAITSSANVACFGACNGSITIGMNGGSAPFAYSWSPGGQTTQSAVNLCPGTYTCIVTDLYGCQSTIVKVIIEPAELNLGISSNDVKCFGTSTGTVTAAGSGGTLPYSYLWPTIPSTLSTVPNVPIGIYTVNCTDGNGCVKSATIAVNEPPLITLTSTASPASCGLANGSATVTAAGGVSGAYTYTWSAGSNTAIQGSLLAGTYNITVKDANNCIQTLAATIPSIAGPTITVSSQSITCFGGTNGAITTTVSGGTGTYIYAWSNGTSNSSATNLSAGLYTVSVTDQAGCVTSTFVTISQPTASLTLSIATQTITCFGLTNGFGTATANGGTPGTPSYTYAWSDGGTAATSNQLGAGNYNLIVTDANGCIATSTMSLVNPLAMSVSLSSTNIACGTICNGVASATTTNGFGTISYLWTGGATPIASQTASGLCAGNYTLVATDQNNCTASSQTIITAPPPLTANISSTGSITCNGGNNGFAVVTPGGGTGAYNYTWSPSGGNTANANSLTAGVYSVTVQDVNLCTNTQTVNIIEPSPLITTLTYTNVKCNGSCDGTANIAFSGGTGTTTFQWLPNLQSGNFVNNLCVGSQTVNITSNGSCTSSLQFTLTQPAVLTAATSATNSNCSQNNGAVCATVSGGTAPLSFQWSNGPVTLCNNNVFSGAYSFSVTDANGCTASASGLVNDISGPVISITSQTNVSCFGGNNGAVTTTVTGGSAPFTYLWSPNGQSTQNVSNFTAGIHNITITDATGCTTSTFVTITEPTQLVSAIGSPTNVSCFGLSNGSAAVSVIGGTAPYAYVWSPGGQTNATMVNVTSNSYTVNIQDANGCLNSGTTVISQPTALSFASTNFTNTSCNGGNNGQISSPATGGTPGYTYSWAPSGSGSVLGGLIAGGYTVTVTDLNNCTISTNFNIISPPPLSATYSSTPATCNLANGSATLTVSGGTPTYNINWTTPGTPTGLIASNIPTGNGWSANITDSKGCSLTQTIGITSGPSPAITGFNIVPPTCFGLSNGTMTINYSSTTAPYNVTWSNPLSQTSSSSALTQSVSGAASGVYTATLTDGTGCSVSASTVVTQPSSVTLITSPNTSICFGNSTQISATAGGGVGGYTYTWTPNIGIGGGPHTVNPIGISSYAVAVTDGNGCLALPKTITINVTSPLTALGFAVSKCDGETAVLTPNITSPGNNGPYNFLWSTGQSNVAVFTSSLSVTANFLSAPNTYTVLIDDGCSIPSAQAVFTVNVNPSPIIDFTGIPLKGCSPLTVTLTATSNGINDLFIWNTDKVQSLGIGNPYTVSFQDSGKYTISLNVTNATTGCSSSITKTDYIEVYPQPIASFYADPQIVNVLDPNFNFINTSQWAASYYWHFGDASANNVSNTSILTNPSHAYTYAGTYDVNMVATSINGCKDTTMLKVEVTPDFSLYIPNTFTPDGNGLNDIFQPMGVGIDEENYRMDIYDRWGEIIFTSDNFRKGWDGSVKGASKAVSQGVYTFKIMVRDLQGGKHPYIGHVTVIKEDR